MSRLRGAWGAAVRVLPSLERLVLLGLVATSMAVSWIVVPVVLLVGSARRVPAVAHVGLSSVSPIASVVGAVVALLVAAVTAFRFDEVRRGPLGLAATMLAQPTIGVAYGAVLTAALALLWRWDRRRAAPLVVASPLFLLAPVLAAVAIMLAAAFPRPGPWARRGSQLRPGAASS